MPTETFVGLTVAGTLVAFGGTYPSSLPPLLGATILLALASRPWRMRPALADAGLWLFLAVGAFQIVRCPRW